MPNFWLCLIFALQAVKTFRRNGVKSAKRISISTIFPLAKLRGTISPELTEIWEARHKFFEEQRASQPPSLYEKVMLSRFCVCLTCLKVVNTDVPVAAPAITC